MNQTEPMKYSEKYNRVLESAQCGEDINQACRENANSQLRNLVNRLKNTAKGAEENAIKFEALLKAIPNLEGPAEEALHTLLNHYGVGGRY